MEKKENSKDSSEDVQIQTALRQDLQKYRSENQEEIRRWAIELENKTNNITREVN
jgi:hypothetical protein